MTRICSIEGCDKDAHARGFCGMHYFRFRTNGHPLAGRPFRVEGAVCKVPGCDRPHHSKGMCGKHYKTSPDRPKCSIADCEGRSMAHGLCSSHASRLKRFGDPLAGRQANGEINKMVAALLAGDTDDCIAWPYSKGARGYGVWIVEGERHFAHRRICKLAHGEPPTPKHQAAHSCGNGHLGCVNPKHLRWATAAENATDKKLHGREVIGVDVHTAKLNEEKVQQIRKRLSAGEAFAHIALDFGVTRVAIADIAHGRNWKHVPL